MLFTHRHIITVPVYIANDHLQYKGRRINVTDMSPLAPFIGQERYVMLIPYALSLGINDNRWKSDPKQLFRIVSSSKKR